MRKIILLLLIVPFLCNAQVGVFRDFVVNASVKQAEAVVPTANLVSYYNFEDLGRDDYSINDGTITNALFSNTNGVTGKFLDVDGNSDYSQIPDDNSLSFTTGSPDGAFSISGWYKFDNTDDSSILLSKRFSQHEYQLGWDTTGYIVFVCFSQGGASAYLDGRVTSWTPTIGQWYHIVATYDGSGDESGMSIYIDKVSQTVTDNTTGTYVEMNNTSADIYLGIYGPIPTNAASHNGGQDMVGIWNKELTQGEINAIYNIENSGWVVTDGQTAENDLMAPRSGGRYSTSSTDITDWLSVAGVTITSATDIVRSGTTSIKLVGTTSAVGDGSLVYDPDVIGIPAAIGDVARFTGWAYITSAATLDIEARIYHQSLGSSAIWAFDQSKLNEWQYFSLTLPRAAASAFSITLKADDGTVYFDDLAVETYNPNDREILKLNPVVWWDDEDIGGTVDGDAVTSWTDRILSKTVTQKGTGDPILELISGERAVEFNGTNALSIAEFAEIDFAYTDPLTIVVQMGNVIDNTGTLVGKQDDATNPVHFQVQRNTTLTNGVGVNLNASSETSTDNYFNHTTATAWTAGDVVTMVADGTALGVEVYQNGTLITQSTTPAVGRGTATQNDDLHFGARGAGGGTLGYQSTGSISNVLIFDYELTPTQIQTVVDNL